MTVNQFKGGAFGCSLRSEDDNESANEKCPTEFKTADIKFSGLRNHDSQESFNIITFEPK